AKRSRLGPARAPGAARAAARFPGPRRRDLTEGGRRLEKGGRQGRGSALTSIKTSAVTNLICPACRASYDATARFCPRCGANLQAEEPSGPTEAEEVDTLIGRLIDGRYRVIERIGTGGMGAVYKVEHQRMGKLAAMKVLHRDLARDHEVMKRFRREAEAVSQLTHPNAVQTFDFGTTADGALYLVMELVRGQDLGSITK